MSDIQFNCPHCKQSLEAPSDMAGQLIECPSCKQTIEVTRSQRRFVMNNAASTSSTPNPYIPMYRMDGVGANLVVYADKVEIVTAGITGFVLKGIKGTKTIPYQSITAIQFKESGTWSGAGYLQFTIPGGNESRNGLFDATVDENTFMFHGQNEYAHKIKNYIESQIRLLRNPPPQQTSSTPSFSAELERLAALRQQGVLSDEEFQQAKARLLR